MAIRAIAVVLLSCCTPPIKAQTQPTAQAHQNAEPPSATQALSAKQEMIRDRIRHLEDRMYRLRKKLAKTEPDSAARLTRAIQNMGRADLDRTANELLALLKNSSNLTEVADKQQELLTEMEGVLTVLLQRGESDARKTRMHWLEQQRRALKQLLDQQRKLRDQTVDRFLDSEEARKLGELVQKIDTLVTRQKKLLAEPNLTRGGAPSPAPSQAQAQLAQDTNRLAQEVSKTSESAKRRSDFDETV